MAQGNRTDFVVQKMSGLYRNRRNGVPVPRLASSRCLLGHDPHCPCVHRARAAGAVGYAPGRFLMAKYAEGDWRARAGPAQG